MPADSQQIQVKRDADGQFAKGQSGNPAGREKGSRNRATVLAEQLFDGACGALANKAVAKALDGDAAAMRLVIGRIIAPRRHRPTAFALPPLNAAADCVPAMATADIDPAQIPALRGFCSAESELALLGDSPEVRRADTALIALDPELASRPSYAAQVADRVPRFARRPPPDFGASLFDWYAWSLARRPRAQARTVAMQ